MKDIMGDKLDSTGKGIKLDFTARLDGMSKEEIMAFIPKLKKFMQQVQKDKDILL